VLTALAFSQDILLPLLSSQLIFSEFPGNPRLGMISSFLPLPFFFRIFFSPFEISDERIVSSGPFPPFPPLASTVSAPRQSGPAPSLLSFLSLFLPSFKPRMSASPEHSNEGRQSFIPPSSFSLSSPFFLARSKQTLSSATIWLLSPFLSPLRFSPSF